MLKLKNQLQRQLNLFSAMERETISKNHVSPKNVRSRGNLVRPEHTLFAALCLFSVISANAQTATTDPGVDINGVTWATRNVGMPGTFAASPEDPGMFYQWNRRVGWSSTDPMVNSDGGTEWNDTYETGASWEKENDPCPLGWHVPTLDDMERSMLAENVWIQAERNNDISGFIIGYSGAYLFLPAPVEAMRMGERSAELSHGKRGMTWESPYIVFGEYHVISEESFEGETLCLEQYQYHPWLCSADKDDAIMVRCVKDAQ